MFYIESNGFAATTFLADAITSLKGMHCFHGTRAIPEGLPLGSAKDLKVDAFAEKLDPFEQEKNVIAGAIHGKFDISLGPLVTQRSGHYVIALREPVARIRSAHNWAKGKFERGEPLPLDPKVSALAYQASGLNANLDDILFSYSLFHVCEHDNWVNTNISEFSKIYQMERYTQDPEYFSEMITYLSSGHCTPSERELNNIFTGKKINSHAKVQEDDSAQQIFMSLGKNQQVMLVNIFRSNPAFQQIYKVFGYDVDWLYTAN
jgi:hypothetical protein